MIDGSFYIRRMSTTYFRSNRIEKGENNLLYLYPEQDEVLNAEDMLELLEILKEKADETPLKLMFVLGGNQLYLTQCARDLYKTHEESKDIFKAQAAVFKSLSTQILVDLLLKVYSPPYPLRPFRSIEKAEKWLLSQ